MKEAQREKCNRKTWLHCGACRPAANNSSVKRNVGGCTDTEQKSVGELWPKNRRFHFLK